MDWERYSASHFMQWCRNHTGPYTYMERHELRDEAQMALIESIRAGDITSLDGVMSPLSVRIAAHHGVSTFEMNSNWAGTSQFWTCPCCGRSKYQISRMGNKGQILAKLVIHHDHMGEAMNAAFHDAFKATGTDVEQINGLRLVQHMGHAFAAYDEVLVCEDCNNADAEAKKMVDAPTYFSFSLTQIQRFISAGDHRAHEVDNIQANAVWQEAKAAYTLRIRLINAVAHAAATDAHWYEPHARGTEPIPVFGIGRVNVESEISQWAYPDPLLKALTVSVKVSTPNLSRWRLNTPKLGQKPPENYVAMLRSEEVHGRHWDSLPHDWQCPICQRRKNEQVYVGAQGKVIFALKETVGKGRWSDYKFICNHCSSTLMSLKREGVERAKKQMRSSYSFVDPEELRGIILARPHSAHMIDKEKAEDLLQQVVLRITKTVEDVL